MKNNLLKYLSVVSFLFVIIPNEKFEITNGMLIALSIGNLFSGNPTALEIAFAICVISALLLIFSRNKYVVGPSFALCLFWLYNSVESQFFTKTSFLFTALCFIILATLSLVKFKREKKNDVVI
jgi:hypothetical protein